MPRTIIITPVLNGFITEVGCQKVVHTSVIALCHDIAAYYNDPKGTEKKFFETKVNDTMPSPCAPPPPSMQDLLCAQTESPRPANPVERVDNLVGQANDRRA